jgi:hypothetical protein
VSADLGGRRTNVTAVLAFVSALSGFSCFWGIGGLLAVLLGIVALREIERANGGASGRGFAIAAIAAGGLNIAMVLVFVGVGVAMLARPSPPAFSFRTPPPLSPTPAKPVPAPRTARAPASAEREPATLIPGIQETRVGRLRLVDVGGLPGELTGLLDAQRRAANTAGEKLLVFVVAPNCLPCNGVSLALPDRRMQAALAGVRLVRVDAVEHAAELERLGVPVESIPGFALLSDALRPIDYVHGGEWDADVPENIAPVLTSFVRGRYVHRRHPFRGPERPDETAL